LGCGLEIGLVKPTARTDCVRLVVNRKVFAALGIYIRETAARQIVALLAGERRLPRQERMRRAEQRAGDDPCTCISRIPRHASRSRSIATEKIECHAPKLRRRPHKK